MTALLQINGLSKSYNTQIILDNTELVVNDRQKIGVIGRNGAGKSTLFKIIAGIEDYDKGSINIHENTRIGYLTQHNDFEEDENVVDYLIRSSTKEDWECGKIAGSFQIKNEMLDAKIVSLAGGYQMRVKLIAMLLQEPNLLLLDEPTNYLDLSTQILLEKFLHNFRGSILLISHDREFIKRTCNETLEIDQGKTILFPRPIEEYLIYKEEQITLINKQNVNVEQKKKHLQKFIDRFGAKASKASQAKSKMKQIGRLKTIDITHPLSTTNINIPRIEDKKGIALEIEGLEIGYYDKLVAKCDNLNIERGQKIAVLGDNGQGKTTLLKTISGEINKLSGNIKWGHNIKIAYYAQHIPATLNVDKTVEEYLKNKAPTDTSEQEIFKMAGNFLFKNSELKKKIPILSGGEKARLCLAEILLQKNDVLLLDEPTNHLDFETVEALALALQKSNVTALFVSHNRTFVEIVATGIIEVKNKKIRSYSHNYEEYVYHLQRDIEEYLGLAKEVDMELIKNNREQVRMKIKEAKKRLVILEKDISQLENEKKELLIWFEENFNDYSESKNRRLHEVENEISEKEKEWVELEMEIEVLNK